MQKVGKMITDIQWSDEKIKTLPDDNYSSELWIHVNPRFSDILFRTNEIKPLGFTKMLSALFLKINVLSKILPGSMFAIGLKDPQSNDFIVKRFYKPDIIITPDIQLIPPSKIEYDSFHHVVVSYFDELFLEGISAYFYISLTNPLLQNDDPVDLVLDVLSEDYACIGTSQITNGQARIPLNFQSNCLCAVTAIY